MKKLWFSMVMTIVLLPTVVVPRVANADIRVLDTDRASYVKAEGKFHKISTVVRSEADITDVNLYFRVNGSRFFRYPMFQKGAKQYLVAMPLPQTGSVVEYYIQAVNKIGEVAYDPERAPRQMYHFTVLGRRGSPTIFVPSYDRLQIPRVINKIYRHIQPTGVTPVGRVSRRYVQRPQPLKIQKLENLQVREGSYILFQVRTKNSVGPLRFRASHLPLGASFDPSQGIFRWEVGPRAEGTYRNIRFSVTDGRSADSQEMDIIVENALPRRYGTAPLAVTNLRAFVNPELMSTTLSWELPSQRDNIRMIEIWRSRKNGNPIRLARLSPSQTSFRDKSAALGVQYVYHVRVKDNRGEENTAEALVQMPLER